MAVVLFNCKSMNKNEKMVLDVGQFVNCKFCGSKLRKYTVDANYNLILGTPPIIAKNHSLELINENVNK